MSVALYLISLAGLLVVVYACLFLLSALEHIAYDTCFFLDVLNKFFDMFFPSFVVLVIAGFILGVLGV